MFVFLAAAISVRPYLVTFILFSPLSFNNSWHPTSFAALWINANSSVVVSSSFIDAEVAEKEN